jgi:hypothetical protein
MAATSVITSTAIVRRVDRRYRHAERRLIDVRSEEMPTVGRLELA